MSAIINDFMKKNHISSDQLLEIKEKRSTDPRPIQDLLIEAGYLKEEELFDCASNQFSYDTVNLDEIVVDRSVVDLIPSKNAIYHGVFPIQKEGDQLVVAMSDPSDVMAEEEIGFITLLNIKPLLCGMSQLSKYIKHYYHRAADSVHEILEDTMDDTQLVSKESLSREEIVDIAKSQADDSAFIRLVNKIICDAIDARASDVHIEPQEKNIEVRYRIDGYLKSIIKIPRNLHQRLAARIKILAKMDIAEQNRVQEGRINIAIEGRKVDMRISMIPLFHGEKIVLRILDIRQAQFDLNHIGFQDEELDTFKEMIHKPQGVVLITGPTGSGKTTTLYSALQEIKCETKNIVTIEDPIEYLMEGINQVQLNRHKDITFVNGLKSILRQDPDVILVGEIRDKETADIAFRASLTGHLVFSTLHTNSSASSITRLLDIGLEPYLIASSINLLVAQRLVRLICPNCCEEEKPDIKVLQQFKNFLDANPIKRFYKGKGCEYCNFSGFFGRTSIFEILKINEQIRDLIFNKASETLILKEAKQNGMRPLIESGLSKVSAGLTTLQEILKVIDVNGGYKDMLNYSRWH